MKGEAVVIQIIEGASGSGKSETLYRELIQASIDMPDKQFILIVPEQFTMQAQRDIVTLHPLHGTMNIDIVSFNRLAYRVFEEQSIRCEHVLEDFGKSMLLQRILLKYRKELPVFGSCLNKPGFIDELKSLLTELFQYRIGKDSLEQVYQQMDGHNMLKNKLHDLLFVYDAFQDEVRGKYIIAEHLLEMLARHIPESEILQDSIIYFDGFTGFTPIQYEVVDMLAQVSASLTITVTIDKESAERETCEEHALFYLSKDTIQRIQNLGEKNQIYVEERFLDGNGLRFQEAEELKHLEENLFRYPYCVWNQEVSHIHLQVMRTQRQELHQIARQIRAMVRTGNYRFRDIAVIHGNLEELEPYAEELFPKLGIPYFIDTNQNIYMNPCLESIRAILEISGQDYSYESVFRFLKTGVVGIEAETLEQLENYVIKRGIRGYSWWKKSFSEEAVAKTTENSTLQKVLLCGRQVIQLLEPVISGLQQAKKVQDYVNIIQSFLRQLKMEEQLQAAISAFEVEGNYIQAKSYSQIYGKLEEIWEKMLSILGTEEMKLEEFQSLLETGLDEISLGVIPPSLDQVTVGDIERTRLNHIKVLFVMGINDGIIPRVTKGSGILSEADRGILGQTLELAPDARMRIFTEQFYLYQNLTKPSEHLYLSYHAQDADGNEVLPAYVIGRMQRLFPQLKLEEQLREDIVWDAVETSEDSVELVTAGLQAEGNLSEEQADIWKNLYEYYSQKQPDTMNRIRKGMFYQNLDSFISSETAKCLYGTTLHTSVSRLETYSRCPYQFFLEYGLGLKKRETNAVSLGDMGSLLHHIVEQVFQQVTSMDGEGDLESEAVLAKWEQLSDDTLAGMVEKEIEKITEAEDNVYLYSYANRQLLQRIQKTAAYAVIDLRQQLVQGSMIPYQFEMDFNRKNGNPFCQNLRAADIVLEQGMRMKLSGIVDRIDISQDEEHVYVKILDYKSSGKELDLTQIHAGLQLQLLVYTNVVLEVLQKKFPSKKIVPAGSLYYAFRLPMVEKTGKSITDALTRKINRETALTGIVNKEEPCIALLGSAETLPVKVKEVDGTMEVQESDTVLDEKQYRNLLEEVEKTIADIGNDMITGKIPIQPVKSGRGMPCDYCDYKDVCKLDCHDGGNQVDTVERLSVRRKGGRNHGMDERAKDNH